METQHRNQGYVIAVDDDPDDRILFQEAWKEASIPLGIQFVEGAFELMSYLEKKDMPAVILLDLNMPNKSGAETLKNLKRHGKYKNIPVIIFTSSSNKNDVKLSYSLGASSYITKPSSFTELVRVAISIYDYCLNGQIGVRHGG